MSKLIICPICGEEKPYFAKGMCGKCYSHLEYKKNYIPVVRKPREPRKITCACCGDKVIHYARGMCKNCYTRRFNSGYAEGTRALKSLEKKIFIEEQTATKKIERIQSVITCKECYEHKDYYKRLKMVLAYIQGSSYQEIGDKYKISKQAVSKLISRKVYDNKEEINVRRITKQSDIRR